jgi:hypothetical protein
MSSRNDVVSAIAREIERHFEAYPNAADSVEGIRGWWLSPALRSESLDNVLVALEELQRRGVVAKTESEHIASIYSKAVP